MLVTSLKFDEKKKQKKKIKQEWLKKKYDCRICICVLFVYVCVWSVQRGI